jgi:hypothetical protein
MHAEAAAPVRLGLRPNRACGPTHRRAAGPQTAISTRFDGEYMSARSRTHQAKSERPGCGRFQSRTRFRYAFATCRPMAARAAAPTSARWREAPDRTGGMRGNILRSSFRILPACRPVTVLSVRRCGQRNGPQEGGHSPPLSTGQSRDQSANHRSVGCARRSSRPVAAAGHSRHGSRGRLNRPTSRLDRHSGDPTGHGTHSSVRRRPLRRPDQHRSTPLSRSRCGHTQRPGCRQNECDSSHDGLPDRFASLPVRRQRAQPHSFHEGTNINH